ncbi:MAG TPA: HAMP domain-containing sensor histidine kinase [Acidimicrobiales bacterium]|jgi:two-component system OmpR family sensor kinase|nr:HAMP domain-containing sensor histidine kinase [Acidimicrobiales bacterium]
MDPGRPAGEGQGRWAGAPRWRVDAWPGRVRHRLARLSLRARLLLGLLALVAVGLGVSDVAATAALRSYLVGRVDRQLVLAQQTVVPRFLALPTESGARQVTGALGGSDTYVALLSPDGTVARSLTIVDTSPGATVRAPSPPRLPAGLSQASGPVTVSSSQGGSPAWRVLANPLGTGGAVVVAASLGSVAATLGHLALIEGLIVAAVLALVAVVARWLVRLGLRPLDRMGDVAGAIAGGDLSRRVEPADPGTEVGRLGQALNAMLTQIEAAFGAQRASEERLRRFVADASHELRTPLTSIRGYAELSRRRAGASSGDLAHAMGRIEAESIRMGGLVEDLLLLARLDQGRPLARAPVDLAVVAADAVADARATDHERPIDLRAGSPVPVVGDEARLRQVAANLLANARQHTPAGTPVAVAARIEGDQAVLEVADQGPGLDPRDAARVFERFYRADASRSRDRGGAGLGLSIVAAITEAHGGRATLETAPGQGTVVAVVLPPARQGPPTPRPAEASSTDDGTGGPAGSWGGDGPSPEGG